MRACVISTFPSKGTQNVGDALIEQRTTAILRDVLGVEQFDVIWREDNITSRLETINRASFLAFACLAIRQEMFPKKYNLPDDLSAIKPPMFALATGTRLRPADVETNALLTNVSYDSATTKGLRNLGDRLIGFSCRGELTYNALRSLGLTELEMTGDVAFWNPQFDRLKFELNSSTNSIAISTPHNPRMYSQHFYTLVQTLRREFASAQLHLVLHGKTPWLDLKLMEELRCNVHHVYREGVSGLDIYGSMDVHVGYRVHAHVSALSHRIPSYLLAIDSRGVDYGRTMHSGSVVKAWKLDRLRKLSTRQRVRLLLKGNGSQIFVKPDEGAIVYLVDLLKRDSTDGYSRWLGFENVILATSRRVESFVRRMGDVISEQKRVN